jgi:hypothetical protein
MGVWHLSRGVEAVLSTFSGDENVKMQLIERKVDFDIFVVFPLRYNASTLFKGALCRLVNVEILHAHSELSKRFPDIAFCAPACCIDAQDGTESCVLG